MTMITSAADELAILADCAGAQPRGYSGFPWWHALLVTPNREVKAAEWLKRARMFVYLPMFSKKVSRGRGGSGRRDVAALPGMLFIPSEMMNVPRRDIAFDYAQVRGYIRNCDGDPRPISKIEIERIRLLEARLNLPPEAKGVFFKVGERVRFKDGSLWFAWGGGVIFEIADETRIGVEVADLFGRSTPVYVPEAEIEAMPPGPVGRNGRIPKSKRLNADRSVRA